MPHLLWHFIQIADSLQQIATLWTDNDAYDDGFFYDVLQLPDGRSIPVRLRSIAGTIPLMATVCITKAQLKNAPRLQELLYNFENNNNLYQIVDDAPEKEMTLLSLLTPEQLKALCCLFYLAKKKCYRLVVFVLLVNFMKWFYI
ncbi:MAG: hypothetical protein WDM90_05710 [Ferruginibacter sp.]